MIGTIRKHSQWLWGIIVVAVILSFVIWSDARGGRPSFDLGGGAFGRIYGKPITRDQLLKAKEAAAIGELLQGGRASGQGSERREAEQLLLQAKIKEFGIQVSDEAVGNFLRENYKDPNTGQFNYDGIIRTLEQRTRISERQFIEYIRQQVAMRHLMEVVGSSASLVTPREAEAEYRRENEQYVASAAMFSITNRLASVVVNPADIGTFYSNRLAYYRIPERTVLVYARFDATNHLAEAEAELAKDTAFTNRFEQYYTQRGADSFRDESDKVMTKEAAFRKVREENMEQVALALARQAASVFNDELGKLTNVNPSSFALVAAKLNVPLRSTPPFRAGERIAGLEEISSLPQRVADLNPETPYTEPLDGFTYVVIPMLQTKLPPETPSLETVKERVIQDYRLDRARASAREAGEKFYNAAVIGLASGKRFADIAAAENIPVTPLPAFSIATQNVPGLDPRLNLYTIKNTAFALKAGEVGRYTETSDGGYVLFLQQKLPVSDEAVKSGLVAALAESRQQRQMAAFQSWFSSEFQKSGLAAASSPDPSLSGAR
jgi:hypothetical protein